MFLIKISVKTNTQAVKHVITNTYNTGNATPSMMIEDRRVQKLTLNSSKHLCFRTSA